MENTKYPMLLSPAFKDYIWGGTRLRDDFGKQCALPRIAESWELSCHPDGESLVANGIYAGRTLSDVINTGKGDMLGRNCEKFPDFPVLIKLIDAKDNLSVQVHPDDAYMASRGGGFGKTEMWYIVDCEPGAELIFGFKSSITKDEFARRIEDNTLLEAVNSVPVKKGDVFFIKSGTLHAIGKGILIAEIQQSSNTTYRVYDYGRTDKNGKSRELHIDRALDVTDLNPAEIQSAPQKEADGGVCLASCPYFTVKKYEFEDYLTLDVTDESFCSLLLTEGAASIVSDTVTLDVKRGDCVFIPAGSGRIDINGKGTVLITSV